MELIENEKISDKSFTLQELKGREITNCTLINCSFSDLIDVKFFDCFFLRCDLSNCNLNDSQFRNCTFQNSRLVGVGISKNNFAFSANFESCDLRYMEFFELFLRKMKIERSNCEGIRFSNCDLRDVKFNGSNFKDAIFSQCDLRKAKLKDNKSLVIHPNANKIKQTEIDIETAINIAEIFGFKVE